MSNHQVNQENFALSTQDQEKAPENIDGAVQGKFEANQDQEKLSSAEQKQTKGNDQNIQGQSQNLQNQPNVTSNPSCIFMTVKQRRLEKEQRNCGQSEDNQLGQPTYV